MRTSRSIPRSLASALAIALSATGLGGCMSFGRGDRDVDRTPVVNTGAGARILYPGRGAPSYDPGSRSDPRGGSIGAPSPSPPSPGAGAAATPGGSGARSASGSGAGSGSITFLGGAESSENRHVEYSEEPIWFKYAALPFAVVAAPFVYAARALRGEPEPGPDLPVASVATPEAPAPAPEPSPPAPTDYDSLMLQDMERELARRQAGPGQSATPRASARPPGPPSLSIAAELAALQRTPPVPGVSEPTPAPAVGSDPTPPRADGIVDRDGDGRIDHWMYRNDGALTREIFDEDFDGRPDRTLHYDPGTREIERIEEDADQDGRVDTWTEYRGGRVKRRRLDADGDGAVDSWAFYRDGQLARHERDTTGDGFRDRVSFYVEGRLRREELDLDGDGRPDAIVRYDADEVVSAREEDTDGDGEIDLVSHYEGGRLARRELLDPEALKRGRPRKR